MLESEGQRIVQKLEEIPRLKSISRGWREGEVRLPCVVVQMSGERAAGFADDREYLTEVTACIRLYAERAEELENIGGLIRKAMSSLKYQRDFAWEDGNGRALGLVERYKTWINRKDEDE